MPVPSLPRRAWLPRPLLVVALLCTALTVGAVAPAATAATASSPSAPQPMSQQAVARLSPEALGERQQPLLNAVRRIQELAGLATRLGAAGYAGAAISVPRWNVTLYWRGSQPAQLVALLARLRRTIPVRVVSAGYSERQLLTQTQQIVRELHGLRVRGLDVTQVGPKPDGSGVQVGVDLTASPALARLHTPAGGRAALAGRLISALVPGRAPVTVFGDQPHWATDGGSRDYDTSPYKGGARIVRAGDILCSTGFSVVSGKTHYMLFAAHCGGVNTKWEVGDTYDGDTSMGLETARDPSYDTGLIKVGDNQATIYDKAWDSSVTEKVVGYQSAVTGTYTCQNGATSGVICNTVVEATLQSISFDNGAFTAVDEDVAHNADSNLQAEADGDSGGPVFVTTSTKGHVDGVGTISGGDVTVTCSDNDDPTPKPVCYNYVDFADLISNLDRWNVQLR